jgi:M6 family metalloprotease-like protein
MKKNRFLCLLSFFGVGLLSITSCGFLASLYPDAVIDGGKNLTVTKNEENENSSLVSGDCITPDQVSLSLDCRAVDANSYNVNYLPSVGNSKILVVPIDFSGVSGISTSYTFDTTNLEKLNTLFFDDGTDTSLSYESVASFYKKSSFGKLNLSGAVTSPYKVTSSGYSTLSSINQDTTVKILSDSVKSFIANESIKLSDFDSNNDGVIDAVWMVYNVKNYSNGKYKNSNMWAYTFFNQGANNFHKVNTFSWASYDFMLESGASKIDAHTYIHETGHMLGLSDYYDYSNNCSPTGFVDIMDANIIDHNSYSKLLLGWTKPYIINGDCEINLASANYENNCIVVPYDGYKTTKIGSKYSFNPFDEYLLIEFYTPTGLNKADSDETYSNNVKGLSSNGFRVYHVDNRLIYLTQTSVKWYASSDKLNIDSALLLTIMSNTTAGENVANETTTGNMIKNYVKNPPSSMLNIDDNHELSIIDSGKQYSYQKPFVNSFGKLIQYNVLDLFQPDDVFSVSSYKKYFRYGSTNKFDNGSSFTNNVYFK